VGLSLVLNWLAIGPSALDSIKSVRGEQANIVGLPNDVVVDWGAGINIEYIFPLLANNDRARAMRLFGLGVFTYAPFSVAYSEEQAGRGFIERVRSTQGVLAVSDDSEMGLLKEWCTERFNGNLRTVVLQPVPITKVQRVWCEDRSLRR
jgi:hypothetical protein